MLYPKSYIEFRRGGSSRSGVLALQIGRRSATQSMYAVSSFSNGAAESLACSVQSCIENVFFRAFVLIAGETATDGEPFAGVIGSAMVRQLLEGRGSLGGRKLRSVIEQSFAGVSSAPRSLGVAVVTTTSVSCEAIGPSKAYLYDYGTQDLVVGEMPVYGKRGYLCVSSQPLHQDRLNDLRSLSYSAGFPDDILGVLSRRIPANEDLAISLMAMAAPFNRSALSGTARKRRIACVSDVGRVRKNNEDTAFAASIWYSFYGAQIHGYVIGVADGAGGHGAGEVASRTAASEVLPKVVEGFSNSATDPSALSLREIIMTTNQGVMARKTSIGSDMVTTLTLARFIRVNGTETLDVGHVGDSRAYLVDRGSGQILRLTEDHKLVDDLVRTGELTPEQARFHPQRNIITSALGMPEPRVDVSQPVSLHPTGSVLVCSDGLSDLVEDTEIARVVRASPGPNRAAVTLKNLANSRGGRDNVSIAAMF